MTDKSLLTDHDIHLSRDALRGRTFVLGNKRAFSLSLPVVSGPSATLLHSHKWFGAYHYGRKFLEGQPVRVRLAEPGTDKKAHHLGARHEVGFGMSLTSARRDYEIAGVPVGEELFVPDAIDGFACILTGAVRFEVEPEFDIRYTRALTPSTASYEIEPIDGGVLVSNPLPRGSFDDATETFVPVSDDDVSAEGERIYAAVQIVGEDACVEILPARRRTRRVVFRKDEQRRRFLTQPSPFAEQAADHAPLWMHGTSHVYVPVRLHAAGHATIVYGFGSTRGEALDALAALRENLTALQAQKNEEALNLLSHASFATGNQRVDTAYVHVLTRLMDSFVARNATAPDTALSRPATMILAGNQYFYDSWKRDENIALGFLLTLGLYDLARQVIDDTWRLQDPTTGRLPQRIRAGEEIPYHSSDGTLWALWRLYQYTRLSGDGSLMGDKLPMVAAFFRRGLERCVDGLLPSGRTTASDYLWETWMDTHHTPRDGFPIEIQLLWIACLRAFRPVLASTDSALEERMAAAESAAWAALQRFNLRGIPADSLDTGGVARDLITPNPYFCFGVGLDLGPAIEREMRRVGRRQLAGRQGIRTLAPQDWRQVFSPEFLDDRRNVRGRRMRSVGKFNYHRGVEWNWLAQFFALAELKYGDPDTAFRRYLLPQVQAALDRGGVGGIGEIFDLGGARGPDFQTWSMSGFLEALQAFAGVSIDVPGRRIAVEPQLPASWPRLSVRKWYGRAPFDIVYVPDGGTHTLRIEFPWGEPPDAEIEVSLLLPPHQSVASLDLTLEGVPHQPAWRAERVAGSRRSRVRFTVPAGAAIDARLEIRRPVARSTIMQAG
jgi:glycogen debranching enzyme